ncbi:N-alpha-acetyltransferase 30 [Ctenocephalides felis]|uniref:N-alpha-acetyltransferase 30 n=1 Tax=Ctenocephalides felis TaxID=7515 RepID=UPI000E6E511D|nr:N-alpha-acetyltransferase 30 [Ctenocephalides felis]
MDLSVQRELITSDDSGLLKEDKASCGNNNILKDDTISNLETDFEVRLNVSPALNGSLNGLDKLDLKKDSKDEATDKPVQIKYVAYESELQMPDIMRLIQKDLSEPYSIYTYRYFIHNWPKLCFLAMHNDLCVGAIVCKLDYHRKLTKRGYIAMLAVDEKYRKQKIGSKLVRLAIQGMVNDKADEVVLETEITNQPALRLYENLGFVRDKRLFRYYLNGVDALRLKLWLR